MNDFKDLVLQAGSQQQRCPKNYIVALTDTMNVISGKWKLPIIASLLRGTNRFTDLLDNIEKITPRMLSKELKELEMNSVVVREVYNQHPVLTRYQLTESGKSLVSLIDTMIDWGLMHRSNVL